MWRHDFRLAVGENQLAEAAMPLGVTVSDYCFNGEPIQNGEAVISRFVTWWSPGHTLELVGDLKTVPSMTFHRLFSKILLAFMAPHVAHTQRLHPRR